MNAARPSNDNRDAPRDGLVLDRCIASCDRVLALVPVIDETRDSIAKLIADLKARFPDMKEITRG